MEKKGKDLTDLIIIIFITLIGLAGNAINLSVFSNIKIKNITAFRYLFYLSIVDTILLIIWPINKLIAFRFIAIPQEYTKIVFRIMAFLLSYLYQMSNWLFMAANFNRARLLINEFKYSKNNKSYHLIVTISISLLLILINLHYLIFYNFNSPVVTKDSKPAINKTHQFVSEFMYRSSNNLTIFKINRIRNKTNLMKFNQIDRQDLLVASNNNEQFDNINNYYENFLAKTWDWIQISIFQVMPIVVNLASTLIVAIYNSKLRNENRKEFNKQFVIYFLLANIYFILSFFNIIHFQLNVYKPEIFHVQMLLLQLFSYSRHSFSFILYFLTFGIYRNVLFSMSCFMCKQRLNQTVENIELNFSRIETNRRNQNQNESILIDSHCDDNESVMNDDDDDDDIS